MKSGIYKIENTINDKCYIGSAINLKSRAQQHINALKRKAHHSQKLQRAWDKYGCDVFAFSIIEIVETKNDLITREQYWIDLLGVAKSGYNILPTAGSVLGMKHSYQSRLKMSMSMKGRVAWNKGKKCPNGRIGYKQSKETKEKISQSKRGKKNPAIAETNKHRIISDETREKLRNASRLRKDFKHSDETRKKLSASHIGRKIPVEQRAKISAALIGRKFSVETIAKRIATRAKNKAAKSEKEYR